MRPQAGHIVSIHASAAVIVVARESYCRRRRRRGRLDCRSNAQRQTSTHVRVPCAQFVVLEFGSVAIACAIYITRHFWGFVFLVGCVFVGCLFGSYTISRSVATLHVLQVRSVFGYICIYLCYMYTKCINYDCKLRIMMSISVAAKRYTTS